MMDLPFWLTKHVMIDIQDSIIITLCPNTWQNWNVIVNVMDYGLSSPYKISASISIMLL